MTNANRDKIDLLQGTLDMLILRTLMWGSGHGYGISQAIRVRSEDVLQVDTGSLYPALHRLEKQGWVRSEWKLTDNKQRAKYYHLTASGKRRLFREEARWNVLTSVIASLMKAAKL